MAGWYLAIAIAVIVLVTGAITKNDHFMHFGSLMLLFSLCGLLGYLWSAS